MLSLSAPWQLIICFTWAFSLKYSTQRALTKNTVSVASQDLLDATARKLSMLALLVSTIVSTPLFFHSLASALVNPGFAKRL